MTDFTSFKMLFPPRALKKSHQIYERWLTTPVAIPNPTDLTLLDDFPHNEIDIAEKIKWVMAKCGIPWERYNPVYPMPRDQTVACPIEGCQSAELTDTQSVKKHLGTVPHMVLLAKTLGLSPAALLVLRECGGCNKQVCIQRDDSMTRHLRECKARRESAAAQTSPKTRGTRRTRPYSRKNRPVQQRAATSVSDADYQTDTAVLSDSQVASGSQTQSSVFHLGSPSAPVSVPQFSTGCFALDPTVGSYPSPWAGTLSSQTSVVSEPQTPPRLEHSPPVSIQYPSDSGYFGHEYGYFYAIPGYHNIPPFDVVAKTPFSFEDVAEDHDLSISTDFSGSFLEEFSPSNFMPLFPWERPAVDDLGNPLSHSCHLSVGNCYACVRALDHLS
ncbi:unnamed protein product [Somion occarium]|uniref:Uncharacterized protein n=1 Tax=Somion occarium TaxID=3059160 RepID=A0ABP1CTN2_9APHY